MPTHSRQLRPIVPVLPGVPCAPNAPYAIHWHEICGWYDGYDKRAARPLFYCDGGGSMSPPPVVERVWKISEPVTSQHGFEIVDVQYRPERGRTVLRVLVDRQDGSGVTLDDLTRVNRELGDLLEVSNVITTQYTLEVSSPGINRPLTRPEHFPRYTGKRVRVRTEGAIEGRRNFLGTLLAVGDDALTLRLEDGTTVRIAFAAVERANYEHDFGEVPARRRDAGRRAHAQRRT
jgi:ribosome maturation factor RimP